MSFWKKEEKEDKKQSTKFEVEAFPFKEQIQGKRIYIKFKTPINHPEELCIQSEITSEGIIVEITPKRYLVMSRHNRNNNASGR